jgi:hypothetical protein
MKRWLLILIVLILPVQATVAAMCSYSAHRSSESADNSVVQMLAHEADSLSAAGQGSAAALQTGVDEADCPICHVGHSSMTVAPAVACAHLHRDSPPVWEAKLCGPLVVDGIEHVPLSLVAG